MKDVQIVVGLVRRDNEILLVRQNNPRSGRDYWTPPAGKVETGETLFAALRREIREETGLHLGAIARVAYLAQSLSEAHRVRWTTHAFVVSDFSGSLDVQDPDQIVLEAKFFALEEAKGLIAREQPLLVMKDPVIHALAFRDHSDYWVVRQRADGSEHFELRPPGT